MSSFDLIALAFFTAYLDSLSPKKRRALLASVSEKIGAPGVIPFTKPTTAAQVSLARETWSKMLPELASHCAG